MSDFLEKAGVKLNGSRRFDLKVCNSLFYKQNLLFQPSLKIGEAYMKGWWECDRLDEFFFKICRHYNHNEMYSLPASLLSLLKNTLFNLQNEMRSRQVAEQHYNLGNDLYAAMLGSSMAYTCGYWKDVNSLDKAQFNKFDLVCRKLRIQPGDHILELGCGWGSFAKFAAENYGCKVIGVNISTEQVNFAQKSCAHLPVKVHLCDYRNIEIYNPKGIQFDHIVSIGLCEHIGPKNYNLFMKIARKNLKEDGLFLVHTIGKNITDYYVDPWINKYIFPNGILPSLAQLSTAIENVFILEDLHNFGADYDKTLMAWHSNFIRNWPLLNKYYDETFFRLWNYYLLSCAGAFRARGMQLWQMILSPKGLIGGYQSVR